MAKHQNGTIYGKLSFFDGWPDRNISKIESEVSDKSKGLQMIRQIIEKFSITMRDVILDFRKKLNEERSMFVRKKAQESKGFISQ